MATHLERRIREFSYPPNLEWGIAVLGYLAVFGVLLPVLMIYKGVYIYIAKLIVMAFFFIGIIGIFTYVVIIMRMIRRK